MDKPDPDMIKAGRDAERAIGKLCERLAEEPSRCPEYTPALLSALLAVAEEGQKRGLRARLLRESGEQNSTDS